MELKTTLSPSLERDIYEVAKSGVAPELMRSGQANNLENLRTSILEEFEKQTTCARSLMRTALAEVERNIVTRMEAALSAMKEEVGGEMAKVCGDIRTLAQRVDNSVEEVEPDEQWHKDNKDVLASVRQYFKRESFFPEADGVAELVHAHAVGKGVDCHTYEELLSTQCAKVTELTKTMKGKIKNQRSYVHRKAVEYLVRGTGAYEEAAFASLVAHSGVVDVSRGVPKLTMSEAGVLRLFGKTTIGTLASTQLEHFYLCDWDDVDNEPTSVYGQDFARLVWFVASVSRGVKPEYRTFIGSPSEAAFAALVLWRVCNGANAVCTEGTLHTRYT